MQHPDSCGVSALMRSMRGHGDAATALFPLGRLCGHVAGIKAGPRLETLLSKKRDKVG